MGTRSQAGVRVRIIGCVAALLGVAVAACHRTPPSTDDNQVLFICEHGAAKSVLAATYFNELASARGLSLRATARGADPQEAPSPATVEGLLKDGLTPVVDRPQPLTASDVRRSMRVVAFDCDLPAMKGLKSMDTCWNGVSTVSDDYARARDDIRARVVHLLDETVAAATTK